MNTSNILRQLSEANNELIELLATFDQEHLNIAPFKDSWTAAQVAVHVTKSNATIVRSLHSKGMLASDNPEKRMEELKSIFLDFDHKLKSPEFILPGEGPFQKEKTIVELRETMVGIMEAAGSINLAEAVRHPALGEITKIEMIHFVLYHTKRHIHQLKHILESASIG